MYIPAWFREDNPVLLHDVMRQHSFAALVTIHEGRPFATHIPFLLDAASGEFGVLRAHLARPNPQSRDFGADDPGDAGEALVIFQGPHAYVSPTWYASLPNVPTWNYAIVHAYGVPRRLDDDALLATLRASVAQYEAPDSPLALSEDYLRDKMRGVVGLEIVIARLEGKFKLSQNQNEENQERVASRLAGSDDPQAQAVARQMQQRRAKPENGN